MSPQRRDSDESPRKRRRTEAQATGSQSATGKLMSFLGCLARSPAESLTLLVKNKMKEIKGRSKMVHIRLAIGKAVAH
ncbi:unnamed protein product [Symbiodinium natans]|uniref:Uncharacterized protein n=1 Tax=Symbiodinium natans TaxID=878477 RepID=A0A812PF89_9DINO|nr:unnamed protein product [Symbiodinium natans]